MTEPEETGRRDDGSVGEEPPEPQPRKSTRTGTVPGQKRMVKKVSTPREKDATKAPVKKTGA